MATIDLLLVVLLFGGCSARYSKREQERAVGRRAPLPPSIRRLCPPLRCRLPACKPGFFAGKLPENCCHTCEPLQCPGTACPPIHCGPGYSPSKDRCCPLHCVKDDPTPTKPPRCALVSCLVPECPPKHYLVTLPGDCCPSCQGPYCPARPCKPIRCKPGYYRDEVPGGCCPVCIKGFDCRRVRCGLPNCRSDQHPVKKPGQCCILCEDRCKDVRCHSIRCAAGHRAVKKPGACCKTCDRKCLRALCPVPKCLVGYRRVVRPGQCCAICERCPREPLKACPNSSCQRGRLIHLPGRCCPLCVRRSKPVCPRNEVYSRCGTACQGTCADVGQTRLCSKECRTGCFCRSGYVRKYTGGPCVPRSTCQAKEKRCHDNEVFLTDPPNCIDVCYDRRPECDRNNQPGCYCKPGFLRLVGVSKGPCVPYDYERCTQAWMGKTERY